MKLPLSIAFLCMLPLGDGMAQKVVAPVPLPSAVQKAAPVPATPAAHEWAARNLKDWPVDRQVLAAHLVTRYGEPQEVSSRSLAWYDNGPWKRTILYKDGDLHNFPLAHRDVLWQTLNYKVPLNKVVALMTYDGSILIDRTRGEITAHCDSEEANTLILNIAHTIITGENTVEQALAYHGQVVEGMRIHEPEEYPQKLLFQTPKSNAGTADAGEESELLRHLMSTPASTLGFQPTARVSGRWRAKLRAAARAAGPATAACTSTRYSETLRKRAAGQRECACTARRDGRCDQMFRQPREGKSGAHHGQRGFHAADGETPFSAQPAFIRGCC